MLAASTTYKLVVDCCANGVEDLKSARDVKLFEDKRKGCVVPANPLYRRLEVKKTSFLLESRGDRREV